MAATVVVVDDYQAMSRVSADLVETSIKKRIKKKGGCVLGLAALLQPLVCRRSVVRRDIPIMLGISIALLVLCLDDTLDRLEGVTLFSGVIIYILLNIHFARRERRESGFAAVPAAFLVIFFF